MCLHAHVPKTQVSMHMYTHIGHKKNRSAHKIVLVFEQMSELY